MYQPIPNLTIPRATPGDSHVLTARGAGVLNQRSFYSSERKMQDLLDLCQETPAEQVLLRCFISIFAKTVDVYCIFTRWNIFGHFGHLDKTSGHSRVIFANARPSLKFCMSYIARTIANIRSVSRLFPRVL